MSGFASTNFATRHQSLEAYALLVNRKKSDLRNEICFEVREVRPGVLLEIPMSVQAVYQRTIQPAISADW